MISNQDKSQDCVSYALDMNQNNKFLTLQLYKHISNKEFIFHMNGAGTNILKATTKSVNIITATIVLEKPVAKIYNFRYHFLHYNRSFTNPEPKLFKRGKKNNLLEM